MRHAALALLLIPLAAPVFGQSQPPSQPLPPGLAEARLLPGWSDAQGQRFAALELVLEPGWKTYWRSPGDTGLPPAFDWAGSRNIGEVRFHWPAPEVIQSGDSHSFGFHDRLVLPFEVTPADPARPVELTAMVDFGLCDNICVPASLSLTAPAAGSQPDPAILAALRAQPQDSADQPACALSEIEDGMQLDLTLTDSAGVEAVAIELPDRPEVWVSAPELTPDATGGLSARADFVPPEGAPFDLDPAGVLVTLIGDGPAVQMRGCDASG